jgi:5-formyltetrahydrofolate cyclo-ligase
MTIPKLADPDSIAALKRSLRGRIKQRLQALADAQEDFQAFRQNAGKQAAYILGKTALYRKAAVALSYAALDSEFDTAAINAQIIKDGKTLALPRINEADNSMEFYGIDPAIPWTEQVVQNHYGIWEPGPHCGAIGAAGFAEQNQGSRTAAFILVPGLAFSRDGGRLGRGKGYYDRYLERLEGVDTICIGVCFNAQALDSVPIEEHDKKMAYILTEEELLHC